MQHGSDPQGTSEPGPTGKDQRNPEEPMDIQEQGAKESVSSIR